MLAILARTQRVSLDFFQSFAGDGQYNDTRGPFTDMV